MKNRYISFTTIILAALGILALALQADAVVPAPDGGYPGFNTAGGQNALFSLGTGIGNTAVDWSSLKSNTDGSFNTALGVGTLLFNVGDQNAGQGIRNTATGAGALLSNTTGSRNTGNGAFALFSNTTGFDNVAIGDQALFSNTVGGHNVAIGDQTLFSNTIGFSNTAVGSNALVSNTEGESNTAIGARTLEHNTTGDLNTANGYEALNNNTEGTENTATGYAALVQNTSGIQNTATGAYALLVNKTGNNNTAIGFNALLNNIGGNANTATGLSALYSNTTGGSNAAYGDLALYNNTSGTANVAVGNAAGFNATTGNNNIYIGVGVGGVADESNACYIASIFGQTSVNGVPVLINSDNKLGTTTSSKRFKDDIKPMDKASEALLALKPVTFHYKKEIDPVGRSQFGLVAEEVEKVNPDLVVHEKDGKPYTVRYDAVNAMLLNEFLKEHKRIEQLESALEAVNARLQQQATQIQKVTAQIDATKPLPHLAVNNP